MLQKAGSAFINNVADGRLHTGVHRFAHDCVTDPKLTDAGRS
eukprot:gene21132-4520_t